MVRGRSCCPRTCRILWGIHLVAQSRRWLRLSQRGGTRHAKLNDRRRPRSTLAPRRAEDRRLIPESEPSARRRPVRCHLLKPRTLKKPASCNRSVSSSSEPLPHSDEIPMSEIPICSYCAEPCDKRRDFFRIERWEDGRAVQRGFACGVGCLGESTPRSGTATSGRSTKTRAPHRASRGSRRIRE
jgi:hypothetical protein